MKIWESSPATQRRAVAFCCDVTYVRFACFIAAQLRAAEPGANYDVCVCSFDSGIEHLVPAGIHLRLLRISSAPFDDLPFDETLPLTAYLRLALPRIFEGEYEQIIYLDSDVFFRAGSFSKLFEAGRQPFAVAAVLDSPQWLPGGKAVDSHLAPVGLNGVKYLNSGVMVLNVTRYCEERIFEETLRFARDTATPLEYRDQSALNGYLNGRWYPLSLRWNWQMIQQEAARLVPEFDPYILHFAGNSKPFLKDAPPWARPYRHHYEQFFQEAFATPLPQLPDSNTGPSPRQMVRSVARAITAPLRGPWLRARLRREVRRLESDILARRPL